MRAAPWVAQEVPVCHDFPTGIMDQDWATLHSWGANDHIEIEGFKAIYLTGWPLAGDRNEPDMKTRKAQLHQSCDDEARLIADWRLGSWNHQAARVCRDTGDGESSGV